MARAVADHQLDRLEEWGFAPSSVIPAMASTGSWEVFTGPETVLSTSRPRHEEMAAFMAGGFAKFTNEDIPGVCLATSGPGAIHLLNGLYDAKDGSPAGGAIVGQTSRMSLGATYQP